MYEDAITRLKRTIMFKKLNEKENLSEDHKISENIISVVREIAPLLERIPENMPEFTLHNANHSAKVVEIMGKIIPSDTLDHLNIIELSILIYAAYLHDIGMTASRDEREEIIANSPKFAKLRIFNEELSLKFDDAKRNGDHRTATFIEDKLFTEFLRRNHVERSHEFIKEKYGLKETPISWKKIPYHKLVQAVCDSHGLPVRELYDTKCWRRDYLLGGKRINVQYLSIILRLADILDLDPERTPRCLLDFINPKDETSIKEWKKHLSIIGCEISPQEISIEGKMLVCKSRFALSNYSVFAQRGFSIPCDKLLPKKFFFDIQASINLSDQYKVSLSPNRSDIVEDENYKKLIDRIQSKIMEGFEIYLKKLRDSSPFRGYVKCVNELLENEILSLGKGYSSQGFVYQEEKVKDIITDLFLNYAPILTISDDGHRVYKTLKNLNAKSLAITDINDWPEKIPDSVILKEIKRLARIETVLLMHEVEGMRRRNHFLKHILGNFSDIYITSVPGVVVKIFHNDKKIESNFSISFKDFTYQIHCDPIQKAPLFIHPPDFFDDEPAEVIYNANHPLVAKILDGDKSKDKAASKAIDILISNVGSCLWHLCDKAYSSFYKRNQGLKESANFNYMLIGILKYYPEIFQEFYEAVEQYWEGAKNLGVISRDEDFIGFSLDDLPWFWNCELSDFNFE